MVTITIIWVDLENNIFKEKFSIDDFDRKNLKEVYSNCRFDDMWKVNRVKGIVIEHILQSFLYSDCYAVVRDVDFWPKPTIFSKQKSLMEEI